jgi:hypothetical protein
MTAVDGLYERVVLFCNAHGVAVKHLLPDNGRGFAAAQSSTRTNYHRQSI